MRGYNALHGRQSGHPLRRSEPRPDPRRVESIGLPTDGHLLALNSYENRVYQVGLDEAAPVIAKFYRPGRWSDAAILEEHAFSQELADAEIPAVPPFATLGRTLHRSRLRFSLTPRRGGRTPELEDPVSGVARAPHRAHPRHRRRDPLPHRPTLDIAVLRQPAARLSARRRLDPEGPAAGLPIVVDQALEGVHACFARAGDYTIRLHGDCHRGNCSGPTPAPTSSTSTTPAWGPRCRTCGCCCPAAATRRPPVGDVLAGYEDFCDFDHRELHLIEALRTLRQIHYAAWLARRWEDPAFPAAFPWFNTQHYWQDHILALSEQIAAMEEGPLWTLP